MIAVPATPSFRLDGRRALVTGAGRGIGLASAVALSDAGASVTLVARSHAEIGEVAAHINSSGGSAECLPLDLTDIDTLVGHIARQPSFDILVNNAGANRPRQFLDASIEDFDALFSLNVKAPFFLAQAVASRLVAEERPGSIIMLSSQMGHVGAANRSIYCATKHAIEGMTKAMAAELGEHGIRVNTICPTFIETPMTRSFFEDQAFRSWVLERIKLGRVGRVEDIMGAVAFLASDASALMTGSSLMLDGGWTSTS